MPAFCGNCGSPLGAQTAFCANCGARAGQAGAPSPAPAAAAASGGSGLKIILIVLGSLFVLGICAVGAIYYAGHRLIQHAREVSGRPSLVSALRDAAASNSSGNGARRDAARRDGCALLSKGEVESILGTPIEKAEGKATDSDSTEHCNYFVKPGTMEQDEDRLRKSADDLKAKQAAVDNLNGSNLNEQARKQGVENLAKDFVRTMAASNGNGDVPVFSFTVERESGKEEFGAFRTVNVIVGSAAKGSNETLSGLGDRALLGPMDSVLSVLKGDTCVTLNLSQVPNGKEKGITLAQKILSRI